MSTHEATRRYLADWKADGERRAAERLARYKANPEMYANRRQALGWNDVVPIGAEPAEPTDQDIEDMCWSRDKQSLRDLIRRCGNIERVKLEVGPVMAEFGLQVIRARHQQFRVPA